MVSKNVVTYGNTIRGNEVIAEKLPFLGGSIQSYKSIKLYKKFTHSLWCMNNLIVTNFAAMQYQTDISIV